MRAALLDRYSRELDFLRKLSAEFREAFPGIAGDLYIGEDGKCDDPHVERLIESFALLAARIHLKLEDELPEVTESLLQVLYPHFLAPVPSMTIAQFMFDPAQTKVSTGYLVPRGTPLYSREINGERCQFRTSYPVTLWPVGVSDARVERDGSTDSTGRRWPAAIVVGLDTLADASWGDLEIASLRFHLHGTAELPFRLYEALVATCARIELRGQAGTTPLVVAPSKARVQEVGFGEDEGLLPYSSRSFLGYRLIQEYFQLPQKFLFVDLIGLDALGTGGFEGRVELVCHLDRPPRIDQKIDAQQFRLGCSPAVNLFSTKADPITLTQEHTEYEVVPADRGPGHLEVHSVDSVVGGASEGPKKRYEPFYAFRRALARDPQRAFWAMNRRALHHGPRTGVFLTLVDLDFQPHIPPSEKLTIQVTCSNSDLPSRLPIGYGEWDFQAEGLAAIQGVKVLGGQPTPSLPPPRGARAQWRLISHLSLNYLSAVDGDGQRSPEVLREILRLYDFTNGDDFPKEHKRIQGQIEGLVGVKAGPAVRRVRFEHDGRRMTAVARGVAVELDFDEAKFVGAGVYLFASVLERFLALYAAMNSFTETTASTRQRGAIRQWPPRVGQQWLM